MIVCKDALNIRGLFKPVIRLGLGGAFGSTSTTGFFFLFLLGFFTFTCCSCCCKECSPSMGAFRFLWEEDGLLVVLGCVVSRSVKGSTTRSLLLLLLLLYISWCNIIVESLLLIMKPFSCCEKRSRKSWLGWAYSSFEMADGGSPNTKASSNKLALVVDEDTGSMLLLLFWLFVLSHKNKSNNTVDIHVFGSL